MPYHIGVFAGGQYHTMADRDEDWIEEHIARPRREGRAILFHGQVFEWKQIHIIRIIHTGKTTKQLKLDSHAVWSLFHEEYGDLLVKVDGTDVTNQFITGAPGKQQLMPTSRPEANKATTFAINRKAVMVIYGHDHQANAALFDWLRAIGLEPQEWSHLIHASGSGSPYIGQVLDQALRKVQAVIAFFTPDEYVTAATPQRGQRAWRLQARPNVLIEAGMALIAHPTRTILAVLGTQDIPSDLAGRHYVRLNHASVAPLHDLASRLRDAGCDTNTTGTDWLNPARFPNRDRPAQAPPDPTAGTTPESPQDESRPSGPAAIPRTSPLPTPPYAQRIRVRIQEEAHNNFTHAIVIETPAVGQFEHFEGQILNPGETPVWQPLGKPEPGQGTLRLNIYTFWATLRPEGRLIIRFVDNRGNRCYRYDGRTLCLPYSTDWREALSAFEGDASN
jgi:predicted nucleotide-binding protein